MVFRHTITRRECPDCGKATEAMHFCGDAWRDWHEFKPVERTYVAVDALLSDNAAMAGVRAVLATDQTVATTRRFNRGQSRAAIRAAIEEAKTNAP